MSIDKESLKFWHREYAYATSELAIAEHKYQEYHARIEHLRKRKKLLSIKIDGGIENGRTKCNRCNSSK